MNSEWYIYIYNKHLANTFSQNYIVSESDGVRERSIYNMSFLWLQLSTHVFLDFAAEQSNVFSYIQVFFLASSSVDSVSDLDGFALRRNPLKWPSISLALNVELWP